MDIIKVTEFITRHFGQGTPFVCIPGDASDRQYFRIMPEKEDPRILMWLPPGHDVGVQRFLGRKLASAGLSVPTIQIISDDSQLVVMEDFGASRLKETLLEAPGDQWHIYRQAMAAIPALHPIDCVSLLPYDADAYHRELALFVQWYLPSHLIHPTAQQLDEFSEINASVIQDLMNISPVFVHRDYHAENLFFLSERESIAQIGMIDFQDARLGHPLYDLVSLLTDARRDVDKDMSDALKQQFMLEIGWQKDQFEVAYAQLSFQRNAKILGIFTRLAQRDQKPAYLALMPRVEAHLLEALQHPGCEPWRAWLCKLKAETRVSLALWDHL